jgi:hypothetical protein
MTASAWLVAAVVSGVFRLESRVSVLVGLRSLHKNKNGKPPSRPWNDLNNHLPAIIHFHL